MSIKKEDICRLCLGLVETDSVIIDNVTREMLNCLLKLNLDVCTDPIMCQQCAGTIKTTYQFKLTYIDKEKCILPVTKDEVETKFEASDVFEKQKVGGNTEEHFSICMFCLNEVKNDCRVPLGSLLSVSELNFIETLPVFATKMAPNDISNSTTCVPCGDNFKVYLNFVLNCLNVEEKIATYIQMERLDVTTNPVQLKNIHTFLSQDDPNSSHTFIQISNIKQEDYTFDEYEKLQNHDDLVTYDELTHIKDETLTNICTPDIHTFEMDGLQDEPKFQADISDVKFKCTICSYEADLKRDINRHMLLHGNLQVYKCEDCNYETFRKRNLKYHALSHMDPSKVPIYKCEVCAYETKRKYVYTKHMLTHNDKKYKCDNCTYEATQIHTLKIHMLTHTTNSMEKNYECHTCPFKTTQKSYLKRHMLIHNDKTRTYKCSICTYETIRKFSLTYHMLIHQDKSDLEMYKCAICAYQTCRKTSLRKHILTHRDASQVKTYKCVNCAYETVRKDTLTRHNMVMHNDISEIEMFKCDTCTYQSKYRKQLNRHMLNHKDESEVEMFKCEYCEFQTRHKNNLRVHMRIHTSEGKKYMCEICSYRTIRKHCLTRHILIHSKAGNEGIRKLRK